MTHFKKITLTALLLTLPAGHLSAARSKPVIQEPLHVRVYKRLRAHLTVPQVLSYAFIAYLVLRPTKTITVFRDATSKVVTPVAQRPSIDPQVHARLAGDLREAKDAIDATRKLLASIGPENLSLKRDLADTVTDRDALAKEVATLKALQEAQTAISGSSSDDYFTDADEEQLWC